MQLAVPTLSHPAFGRFRFVQDPRECTQGREHSCWVLDCLVLGVLGIGDGLSPASIIKPCSSPGWSARGGRRQCKVRRNRQ